MTIVLGLSLIITFIANLGIKVKEGMDNMNDTNKKQMPDNKKNTDNKVKNRESMNMISKKGNRIDYASTVEDAYDDLSKLLGNDGIKRLTGDTQQLLEQQIQLADAMKNMTPLIDTAKSLINGLNMEGLNGLTEIAQKLIPSK